MKSIKSAAVLGCLVALGAAAPAAAQKHDFTIDNSDVRGAPLEQRNPAFPEDVARGQEGWVRINFVIDADGATSDPVIIDSTGGDPFEAAARAAVRDWRFEPTGQEQSNNTADIRFEMNGGKDRASNTFLRRYQRIMLNLHYSENDKARESVDALMERGGWNLYESTMLCLMAGRVDGAEGNMAGRRENYRRALRVSKRDALDENDVRDMLAKLFDVEMELQHYAAAARTLDLLKREPGALAELAPRKDKIEEMANKLKGDAPLIANARVFNPSHTKAGEPLWSYRPARPSFSFAALNGNVERFEVRCEQNRLQGPVEAGKAFNLPESASNCRVFVFGDDGAEFQFVEYAEADDDSATGQVAVARGDVLD